MLQNLKCRTTDHSRRQGEFVDIAEQCKNMTTGGGDRSTGTTSLTDSDYSSQSTGQRYSGNGGDRDNDGRNGKNNNNNNNNHRRNAGGDGGRRNNNREFSVRRQDFASSYYNDNNSNNNRGNGDNNRSNGDNNRGNGDNNNRDSASCDAQPREYSSSVSFFCFFFL